MTDELFPQRKRITLKHARPNPLFQDWLEELLKEAHAKKSKLEPMLNKALTSLSKYPLQLKSGAECGILQGFDRRLCIFLDKRLDVYYSRTNSASNSETGSQNESENSENASTEVQNQASNQPENIHKALKSYKPTFRSGGYAILMALLEHSTNQSSISLKKDAIIEIAQKYSEESFTRPKPESFYTAWSNMTRLVNKGLVSKIGKKKLEYSLTEQGYIVARELLRDTENRPTMNDIIFKSTTSKESRLRTETIQSGTLNNLPNTIQDNIGSTHVKESIKYVQLSPKEYEIILLIDKNETSGTSKKNDPTMAQFNKFPDLKHEYRSLKVGDFTWIAQHKVNKDQELVLPYVVERKRMDDLGASIKDGRFHEQKFRLRKCGLKNVIYLVENYGSNKFVGLPIQSLMQALANTRVQDGFKVHITDSLTNSARFLAMMTKRLTIQYEDKGLKGCDGETEGDTLMTFQYFNKSSSKSKPLTVTETFIKILLQLKGVSVEKALSITSIYKTPISLINAYEKCDQKEGEMLLKKVKCGDRNVGPVVSKAIYHVFTKDL